MGSPPNFYEILNIPKDCSPEEIRNAYKLLAKKWHPDKHPPSSKHEAEAKFKTITQAYEVPLPIKQTHRQNPIFTQIYHQYAIFVPTFWHPLVRCLCFCFCRHFISKTLLSKIQFAIFRYPLIIFTQIQHQNVILIFFNFIKHS